MKLTKYIRMDKAYRNRLLNTDIRNLGIGAVGMFLFSSFVLNWGLCSMDHIVVLYIYLICFTIAQTLYIHPLIMVYEGGYVSVFRKYKNIPINKRLFVDSKLILLTRFAIFFSIPVQLLHFWGLERTDTPMLGIIGLWPMVALIVTLFIQIIFIKILARSF